MIEALRISNYRSLDSFNLTGLTPVNLLVGRNCSGKTSVLEAIELLGTGGSPAGVVRILQRRRELIFDPEAEAPRESTWDPGYLFPWHELKVNAEFQIVSTNGMSLRCVIEVLDDDPGAGALWVDRESPPSDAYLVLYVNDRPDPAARLRLSADGGLQVDRRVPASIRPDSELFPTRFVSTESLSNGEMLRLWDRIQIEGLTREVVHALQVLDPRISEIFFVSSARAAGPGPMVRHADWPAPVPIGSMGDGVRRMMGLTLAMLESRNGTVLVDEIDTGLHHSVLCDMWSVVLNAAHRLGVQIFATTHSSDCVDALASCLSRMGEAEKSRVSLHRLQEGGAIRYDADEIKEAAIRHIEVRG